MRKYVLVRWGKWKERKLSFLWRDLLTSGSLLDWVSAANRMEPTPSWHTPSNHMCTWLGSSSPLSFLGNVVLSPRIPLLSRSSIMRHMNHPFSTCHLMICHNYINTLPNRWMYICCDIIKILLAITHYATYYFSSIDYASHHHATICVLSLYQLIRQIIIYRYIHIKNDTCLLVPIVDNIKSINKHNMHDTLITRFPVIVNLKRSHLYYHILSNFAALLIKMHWTPTVIIFCYEWGGECSRANQWYSCQSSYFSLCSSDMCAGTNTILS